ncbi:SpoIIE family protein phosphatase [Sinosporangium siamense]|uniref:Response regulatory domain-containing protein n=1 Tax=Sinosporangium siamense TaxID=1367973 RepID=A0A919RNQ0_9ACTN|nr:SpoIIE family protein phosphatase [Sinosporangium siamense]GII96923.1 hypothetical protein Ssi02_71540 [Sinosporangium siamense]
MTQALVLVVDDTPTKLYILASWLRRAGYRVAEAGGGLEALKKVEQLHPDLVVLDVRLPDISGYEVCERIKGSPATASIPVIQISGTAITTTDRAHGLQRGADAYLAEPIEPEEFGATVEAMLRYYRARHRAERLAGRLSALTELTLAMNAATTFDELLLRAVAGTRRLFGRPAHLVALMPDGHTRLFTSGTSTSMTLPRSTLETLSERYLGDRTGTAVEYGFFSPVSAGRLIVVSRTKPDRPAICLAVHADPDLDDDERSIIRQLGQAIALTFEGLRAYAEEHAIALTLQRSLLPAGVPDVPGLDMSWRYLPAADGVEVGGDFYEVLELDGRILVGIGDVQGHSLRAATVMAELRHALRASLIGTVALDQSLRLLNDVLLRYHPGTTATVCLILIDPATGDAQIANAGHIPPLFIDDDGKAHYHRFGDLMLGVVEENFRVDHVNLASGTAMLLFTDGLVEDRDVELGESLERVRREAKDIEDDLESFTDRLIDGFGAREDDVALVLFRRHLPGPDRTA